MKKYIILILICSAGELLHSQCTNNLLINGSFNSVKGEAVVANGWMTGSDTPDINDINGSLNSTPGYSWTGTPLVSPDGGTWQNVFGFEAIKQTINVIPGNRYQLCFYYAAQGIDAPGGGFSYSAATGVRVLINSVSSYTSPLDATQYSWESACYTFSSSVASVTIQLTSTEMQYLAIDGVCLKPEVVSSIDEYLTPHAGIFQSSFKDNYYITVNSPETAEIFIYDLSLRLLKQQEFTSTLLLTTEDLQKGLYVYEIRMSNKLSYKGKIIKD